MHRTQVRHGNEDTFREMLRIKRSVAAQFNTAANLTVFEVGRHCCTSTLECMGARRGTSAAHASIIFLSTGRNRVSGGA